MKQEDQDSGMKDSVDDRGMQKVKGIGMKDDGIVRRGSSRARKGGGASELLQTAAHLAREPLHAYGFDTAYGVCSHLWSG